LCSISTDESLKRFRQLCAQESHIDDADDITRKVVRFIREVWPEIAHSGWTIRRNESRDRKDRDPLWKIVSNIWKESLPETEWEEGVLKKLRNARFRSKSRGASVVNSRTSTLVPSTDTDAFHAPIPFTPSHTPKSRLLTDFYGILSHPTVTIPESETATAFDAKEPSMTELEAMCPHLTKEVVDQQRPSGVLPEEARKMVKRELKREEAKQTTELKKAAECANKHPVEVIPYTLI
jgi:hypothetical protein